MSEQLSRLTELPVHFTELIRRIAELAARNSVVLGLRVTCRYKASALPDYTAVRIGEPVPEAAFAEHFSKPEAISSLSLKQRRTLIAATKATASVANTQLLVMGPGGIEEAGSAGCTPPLEALVSAAGGGHLEVCRILRSAGCAWDTSVPHAAAVNGRDAVLEWCLSAGCTKERKTAAPIGLRLAS
jgi:hypothetical protein